VVTLDPLLEAQLVQKLAQSIEGDVGIPILHQNVLQNLLVTAHPILSCLRFSFSHNKELRCSLSRSG
jgi:hypothetical protein